VAGLTGTALVFELWITGLIPDLDTSLRFTDVIQIVTVDKGGPPTRVQTASPLLTQLAVSAYQPYDSNGIGQNTKEGYGLCSLVIQIPLQPSNSVNVKQNRRSPQLFVQSLCKTSMPTRTTEPYFGLYTMKLPWQHMTDYPTS